MGLLHDKMLADMRLRNLAANTQERYLQQARDFAAYFRRSPIEMGEPEIREFLLHLIRDRQLSPATHYVYVGALKFLYRVTLRRPEEVERIPWPKVPRKLPDILSRGEVEQLLNSARSIKYQAIAMIAYGAGLRVSEVCSLQVTDIDSKRMLIHVRGGKGRKDRYVRLSHRLLAVLRAYWRRARPSGPYLFPGQNPQRSLTRVAAHYGLQRVAAQCAFTKRVSMHRLRHAYATHLLELGVDVVSIQHLLGHSSLLTTLRYLHMSSKQLGNVASPLDQLGTAKARRLG